MSKILIFSKHPLFLKQSVGQIDAEIIECFNIEDADALLRLDLQACLIDGTDQAWVEVLWQVERLQRRTKASIIVVGSFNSSDEAGLYKSGCKAVIGYPLQAETLNRVLAAVPDFKAPVKAQTSKTVNVAPSHRTHELSFSAITDVAKSKTLAETCNTIANILKQTFSLNRVAIYLKEADIFSPKGVAGFNTSQLSVLAKPSTVISELLEHQCVVKVEDDENLATGWSYAIPLPEDGKLLGFALVGEPIAGQGWCSIQFSNVIKACLTIAPVFSAMKNKEQSERNLQMLQEALKTASPVFILLNSNLEIVEYSKTAQRHFGGKDERTGKLTFERIPRLIGSKMFQVLKTNAALEAFEYASEAGVNYIINITPVSNGDAVMLFAVEGKPAIPQSTTE